MDMPKIGLEEFDEDHKILFYLTGVLENSIINSNTEMTCKVLYRIYDMVEEHFHKEEAMLVESKFPNYSEHKEHHDQFKDSFIKLLNRCKNNKDYQFSENDASNILNWLEAHIEFYDMKYVTWLKWYKRIKAIKLFFRNFFSKQSPLNSCQYSVNG